MRICALLPSATEIVASLGIADSLVAVSEECDWPAEVRGLPLVTAPRAREYMRCVRCVSEVREVRVAVPPI